MITIAEIHILRVPMAHPAAAPLETVLVRLVTEEGIEGLGECATAPRFDGVTAQDVAQELAIVLSPPIDEAAIEVLLSRLTPGARCALDIAMHDLEARRRGIPLAELLGGAGSARVPVNALIAPNAPRPPLETARDAWARGIRTFKIKSGTRAEDGETIQMLRATFGPEARLRLDAGGRWTHREAPARIRDLEPFDLEFVEQPVAGGNLTAMAVLAKESAIPLAADEDATDALAVREIGAAGAAAIVVVKLPPAGGIKGAMAMLEAARGCGLGAVVTGMMDTSVGLAAALHVAAAAGPLAGACGFGTLQFLAADVVREPLRIEKGRMKVPSGPGLGVALDPAAVSRLGWEGGAADA